MSEQDETQPYDIYLGHIASPPQRVEIVDAGGNDPVTVSTTVAGAINQFGAIDRVQFEGRIETASNTEVALREDANGDIADASFADAGSHGPIEDDRTDLERIADEVELESKNLGSDDELPYVVQSTVNEADEDDPLGYDKSHVFGGEGWSLEAVQQLRENRWGHRPISCTFIEGSGEKVQELQEKIERVRELAKEIGYDPDFWKLPADPWKPEVALLDEAKKTITAGRQDQYGDAEDSFSTIGQFWTTFLRARHPRLEIPHIKGSDVALMLDLMKTARQAVTNKHDNLVDKAGYTALAARCIDREKGW